MGQARLLLPFVHGLQPHALEQAIYLAKVRDAVLVPLALLCVPKTCKAAVRLEHVQQAKDFLEAVRCRADRHHVPIEQHEINTSDVSQSVMEMMDRARCAAILLFTRGNVGVFLDTADVKSIMEHVPHKLYLFRLEAKDSVRIHVCQGGQQGEDKPSSP